MQTGEELVLSYSVIRSVLISDKEETPKSQEKLTKEEKAPITSFDLHKKKRLFEQSPADALNVSDRKLKEIYDSLPREDKIKLNRAFDSFRYGISTTNPDKMLSAANLARKIVFDEADFGYQWSRDAIILCFACFFDKRSLILHRSVLVAALLHILQYHVSFFNLFRQALSLYIRFT